MINYDMPFLSYDEQIDRLIYKYGLIINDREFAKNALINISYYDLINGYKNIFMYNEKYLEKISMKYIFVFHIFNKNLQNILFKYSVYVENRYKNNLAYVLGENLGVDIKDYLNLNNYIKPYNSKINKERVELFNKIKNTAISDKIDNPTKHYKKNHNHIPPWILFKNISWGDTIDLLKYIDEKRKRDVAKLIIKFKTNPKFKTELLSKSLTITRKYRNKIAHNLKFITYKSPEYLSTNILPYKVKNILKNTNKIDRPLSMIISLVILLSDELLINAFIDDLSSLLTNTQEVIWYDYSKITNIPINIIEILKKLY